MLSAGVDAACGLKSFPPFSAQSRRFVNAKAGEPGPSL
jgi:hypothetical protein